MGFNCLFTNPQKNICAAMPISLSFMPACLCFASTSEGNGTLQPSSRMVAENTEFKPPYCCLWLHAYAWQAEEAVERSASSSLRQKHRSSPVVEAQVQGGRCRTKLVLWRFQVQLHTSYTAIILFSSPLTVMPICRESHPSSTAAEFGQGISL